MSQLLSQLPVGALVVDFNTKYNDEPIIWQVLEHGHSGDPEGSTTLCSLNIITLKCFDAKEPNNSDSNRKSYGNNRYLHSNILQWLNSNATNWYTAQHSTDQKPDSSNVWASSSTPINPYDTEAGFLTNFSAELKAALQTVTKTTAKNTVTDGGSYETVTSKIFLLSTTEVGLANENNVAEGSIYKYYQDSNTNDRRKKNLANDAAKGNYSSATSPWLWWLRTPYSSDSYYARIVYTDGTLNGGTASNGNYGVAPGLCIPSTTEVGDEPAADGVYTLFPGWSVKQVYLGNNNNEAMSIYKDPVKIVSWQNGTDEEVGAMIDAYYNNELSLEDIQSVWSVGDTRTVTLSAMAATGVGESHRAQDVEMQIIDFNHDTLTTSQGGKTKALITIDLKNCLRDASVGDTSGSSNTEHGYMNSSNTNVGGWTSCARRTWCNNVFYNALPTYLKNRVKPVNKLTSAGNKSDTINTDSDKCFLLSEIEIFGSTNYSKAGEGSQYTYYATASNRYKLPKWSSSLVSDYWWERSPDESSATNFCRVSAGGGTSSVIASRAYGLAPACCL